MTHAHKKAPNVILRPLVIHDFAKLTDWINADHVAKWWDGPTDINSVVDKYGPRLGDEPPTRVFIIEIDDIAVGMIQCYRHRDYPDWDRTINIAAAAGIDYIVGDSNYVGKGIGSAAIRAITTIAFNLYPEIEAVVSAPQKDNHASWRALEKAGFERVDERKLESDCPSDAGISYIYVFRRSVKNDV